MASRFILPFSDVGNGISPSDGATLDFFITGTSSRKDTFTDEALSVANANPVVADSDGLFSDIWVADSSRYKVVLKDKNGVQQWSSDPVVGGISAGGVEKSFDTVALMVADVGLNVGEIIQTAGYISKGDGGDNRYEIVAAGTGTDDGGEFIDLSGSGFQAQGLFPTGKTSIVQWGAIEGGVTDSLVAINAAIASGRVPFIPEKTYRISGTVELDSLGAGIYGLSVKSILIADLAVSPCIRIGASAEVKEATLKSFRVTRVTGTIPTSSIGILWNLWNYGREEDVVSDRHGDCWSYLGPPASVAIGHRAERLHAYDAATTYVRVKNIADLFWDKCETGRNGGESVSPASCLSIEGDANDIVFTDTVFVPRGPSSSTITSTIDFSLFTGSTGVLVFNNCNTENVLNCFKSTVATTLITEFKVTGGRWTGANIFDFHTSTKMTNCGFVGASFGGAVVVIENFNGVRFNGCFLEGITLTSPSATANVSSLSVSGCNINGPVTLSGAWFDLQWISNTTEGTYSNTTTGNTTFLDATGLRRTTVAAGTVFATVAGQQSYGTATPASLLTIKQISDNDAGGIKQIMPSGTDTWSPRPGSDGHYYFAFNGTALGQINKVTGVYAALSDKRVKKDIKDVGPALENIRALRPVVYRMRIEEDNSHKHYGFIAQEVKKIIPSSVNKMVDGTLTLDKTELIALLVKAVQELEDKLSLLAGED